MLDFAAARNQLIQWRSELTQDAVRRPELLPKRTYFEAKKVLDELEKVLKPVISLFENYPILKSVFEREFFPETTFTRLESFKRILYCQDYVVAEKFFGPIHFDENGELNWATLSVEVSEWCSKQINSHLSSPAWFKEVFTANHSYRDIPCKCLDCSALYREAQWDTLYKSAREILLNYEITLKNEIQSGSSIDHYSDIFRKMLDEIQRVSKIVENKLKKGLQGKFDRLIRSDIRAQFSYSSETGKLYCTLLLPHFKSLLEQEYLSDDFVSQEEMERFLTQLGSDIWRPKLFLTREFLKLIKSLLLLKRKDVSSSVLQDYLGKFWTHTTARLIKRKIIYHMGPTNSGKTYHAIKALGAARSGFYLAPLRLLAAELFDTLNGQGVKTTLLTGEEIIEVEGSSHTSSTIEMCKLSQEVDCAVIDEIQMITDPQRGWAWTRALVNLFCPEIHVCGDDSVLNLIQEIVKLTGDELIVKNYQRMCELKVMEKPLVLGELRAHDALIVFSRRNALKYKRDLEALNFKVSIVYGRLSPEVRREQARKFDKGETDIMVSTDAIAMGMNLPVKRIIFSTLTKFIDEKEILISTSEIKQISGRAGRFGRFPIGEVGALTRVENGPSLIEKSIHAILEQKTRAMVGPDLEIFNSVNDALMEKGLAKLKLSEFLRLFNTMNFTKPFLCVDLTEMIELAEMVEAADKENKMSSGELFGFACAPVNLAMPSHVEYYHWILSRYVADLEIEASPINAQSDDIEYLENNIKCVELYQWLSRHFKQKNFSFDESELLENKTAAVERLNFLLSQKIVRFCSSCGKKMSDADKFNICEECFRSKRFAPRRRFPPRNNQPRTERPFKGNDKRSDRKKKFFKHKTRSK